MNKEHKEDTKVIIKILVYAILNIAIVKCILYTVSLNKKEIINLIKLILELSDTKKFKDMVESCITGKNQINAKNNFDKIIKEFTIKHQNKGKEQ